MINVLYIGQYNGTGKFNTIQWKCFMKWCKVECNKIIVYSEMPYDIIRNKFPLYCDINELRKPDERLNIYAYEINVNDIVFWDYIEEYNYNIDIEDNISHLFFLDGEKDIASLEIVDYENYILIEAPINRVDKFLLDKKSILDNIRYCMKGKSDIDDLVQEEYWKPLGSHDKVCKGM